MTRLDETSYREAEQDMIDAYGVAVTEHRVAVAGTTVRVLESGSGDPILFVHGSPNNAATWIPLIAELRDRQCLLIERPGAGLSEPMTEWTDHRSQSTAIVTGVADHFGLPSFDLVGSSFGGLYGYNVAIAQPDRVRTLIQMGSPAGPLILGLPTIFRFLSLPLPRFAASRALRPNVEEAKKMFGEIGHESMIRSDSAPEVVFEWYSALLRNTDTVEHLFDEIRAIVRFRGYRPAAALTDTDLAGIDIPVRYLWGSEDPFASVDRADRLTALTPAARIEHFDGFGHLVWYDDPGLIAGRVRTITGQLDTPPVESDHS